MPPHDPLACGSGRQDQRTSASSLRNNPGNREPGSLHVTHPGGDRGSCADQGSDLVAREDASTTPQVQEPSPAEAVGEHHGDHIQYAEVRQVLAPQQALLGRPSVVCCKDAQP